MRIAELRLAAFGPFTDHVLDLRAADGAGLHLIYGPNEAGKTTALRAVRALFYGVPERTGDGHRHGMPRMRVGAVLQSAGGLALEVWRRKGRRDTLLGADGEPIDPARLQQMLGGVDEELFATMFGLDHDGLVRGARALLEDGGDVGESLFGAGLGGSGVHRVLRRLHGDADRLWSPAASKKPINESLRAFRDARNKSRELALPARCWLEGRTELRRTEREQRNAVAELRWLATERHRLERLRQALPLIARRRLLLAEQEALAEYAELTDADGEDRRDAQGVLREAAVAEDALGKEIERLTEERDALLVPAGLLAQETAVVELRDALGGHRKAAADLPRLRADGRALEQDLDGALGELGWAERPLEDIEAMRTSAALGPAQQGRIEGLGRRMTVLEEKLRAAVRALSDVGARERVAGAERDALGDPVDVAPLSRAVERAVKDGDLERRAEQAARALAESERWAQADLEALGLWSGPADELRRLAVPSLETVARFEQKRHRLAQGREHLDERTRENAERRSEVARQIDALRLGGEVPTELDLLDARDERERAWALLRRRLGGEDVTAEVRRFDVDHPERNIVELFEDAVERVDAIADRLRREADRVARLAGLLAEQGELERTAEALESSRHELRQRQAEEEAAWCAAWAPAGIDPLPPTEMRAWLQRLERVREAVARVREDQRALEELHRRIEEHRVELQRGVEAVGAALDGAAGEAAPDGLGLGGLIDRAVALVDRVAREERRRDELDRALAELAATREIACRDRDDHADALAGCRQEWARLIEPLGLALDASPAEASAVLGRCQELFARLDRARELRRRIAGIERDAERFAEQVARLTKEHAPDLAGRPPERAADELLARFERGRLDRATRTKIEQELASRERALEQVRSRALIAEERLEALKARAGCGDVVELEHAERRARRQREVERELAQLEEDLLIAGGRSSIDELIAQAEGLDVDRVESELAELQRRIEILRAQVSELDQSLGRLRHELESMDGASRAADAAAEAQQILARVRGDVGRYVRYRLAAVLLGREVERYREQNQGPVLGRASELFERLTIGAFARLTTGFDEKDRPVLRCVRASGEELSVRALSAGTRDQLYLALRLASLERHSHCNEPIPLVVDDVLIHFDDARARAALAVLGELAATTQVLLFTHHARHAELAREAVPDGRLVEHVLEAVPARA